MLWSTVGQLLWRFMPMLRPSLLRLFGGRVGKRCRFAGNVEIAIPWNLHVGNDVEVAPRVILYSLGLITLGDRVVLDYRVHLCAGTHDMEDSSFPLLKPPISIGEDTFIGIDAFIGPDVTLGRCCRIWPRASVYRNFPDETILRGNPARPVESSELKNEDSDL